MDTYRKHKDTKLELNAAKRRDQEGKAVHHSSPLASGTPGIQQLTPA
jgi:hypothetical protein